MFIALVALVLCFVWVFILGAFLILKIERSGVRRWGATGHFFKYKTAEQERGDLSND